MRDPKLRFLLVLSLSSLLGSAVLADARGDLQIKKETDAKKYTIYTLVNAGEQTVRVKIRFDKQCTGVANNQEPTEQEYVLAPKGSVELGRVWPQSTCKRDYRIVQADYPQG
jgi:hypothetical protein